MASALKAGIVYFGIVFSAGFVLGTIRVLFVAPQLGATGAVAIELPVMLALSWIASARLVRWFDVPSTVGARVLMGVVAFALLMAAELGVSVFAFGRSAAQHFATFGALEAQLGLVAQLLFAAFPLLQAR
jgi:hypothetical protein